MYISEAKVFGVRVRTEKGTYVIRSTTDSYLRICCNDNIRITDAVNNVVFTSDEVCDVILFCDCKSFSAYTEKEIVVSIVVSKP